MPCQIVGKSELSHRFFYLLELPVEHAKGFFSEMAMDVRTVMSSLRSVVEGKHIEEVRIGDHTTGRISRVLKRIGDGRQEIIVVGDKQGVLGHAVDDHVLGRRRCLRSSRGMYFREFVVVESVSEVPPA